MEDKKKLYTLLVYSENIAGILNQITAVFTRRQVNIESLSWTGGRHRRGRRTLWRREPVGKAARHLL